MMGGVDPSISVVSVLNLICVAILWGVTNPLMGRGSSGIIKHEQTSSHRNPLVWFASQLRFLFLNWKFVLPFLVNQCGSVLFYFTLSSTELSVAVPLTNGLTFLFTSLAGQLLGEHPSSSRTYAGMLCVVLGVALCLVDRLP